MRYYLKYKAGSKYGAKKKTIDGITFDSTKEANRYVELLDLERKGFISDLKLQQTFELQPKFRYLGKAIRAITYIADFTYYDENGDFVVEDVKGYETPDFKLKYKMFIYKYPDYKFIIYK